MARGIAYLNQALNGGKIGDSNNINFEDKLVVARVTDIVLNTNSKLFNEAGGWASIGQIKYQILDQPTTGGTNNTAKPLFPQNKNYPLVNELVLLFRLPSSQNPGAGGAYDYYYFNPIGIWNHPEQNGYPSYLVDTNSPSQQKSYQSIEAGATNKESNEAFELDLNGTSGGQFVENGNVKPTVPFAGDNIFESRFGSSIRLGSTAKTEGGLKNNWSSIGQIGSPITILRNGQPEISGSNESWVPIVENINDDPTSLYMTSTQRIPIEIATLNKSVGEASTVPLNNVVQNQPKDPRQYSGSQVMINSDRLLFNTKADSIILTAQKSVIAEANNDLGFRSRNADINFTTPEGYVNLGGMEANESLVLGDTFMTAFSSLLKNIETLCSSLTTESTIQSTQAKATMILPQIQSIQNQLDNFLSKKVKSL